MTRVLVTGAAGQVGVDLLDVLSGRTPPGGDRSFQPDATPVGESEFEVLGLSRHDLDITNRDAVMKAVETARPDVIVHLAAYTAVDKAQTDRDNCFLVNAQGTESLSLAAKQYGSHLIAVSTDYVFDGNKGSAYEVDDQTNPLGVYGASKLLGEQLCSEADTIVRTSWVMGVRGKNVLHVIADRALSGENVRFVDDQTGTVTVASDLARALATFVRTRPGGIWHVANTETTTWFEVARYAGEVLSRGDDFATAIKTSDLRPAPLAPRPIRSDLSTKKWNSSYGELPNWHDAVTRLLHDRAKRNN
jgi:dTDP-4-dehydrorhamnose reductase